MTADDGTNEVVLVRHAETEWSLAHRHTGRTDVPLTEHGRAEARGLAPALAAWRFELVLTSPARRARETCELCGFGAAAQAREDMWEWDYGAYEGLTMAQIQAQRPGWSLWRDGCPDGEDAAAVGARVDRVIEEARAQGGDVAIFAHGHVLRVFGTRWIGLEPAYGAHFALSPASISVLGYERGASVMRSWNRSRSV
jgi:probable phosphoglycerate mutase